MRTTALAWLAGGAFWLVAGLVDHGTHEALWLLADALIAVGLVSLWRADLHHGSRLGSVGLALAALARVSFLVAEIVAAVSGDDDNVLLPIGALGTAVGMTAYGVAVLRAGGLAGPSRLVPLLVGIYPFAAMFPIVAATGEPSDLAIALWGIPLAALGMALAPTSAPLPARG